MKNRRKSTRRDFLKGQSARDAVDALLPDAEAEPPRRERVKRAAGSSPAGAGHPLGESLLLEVGRRAMACDFQILLNAGQHPRAAEAALAALDLVESLEDQMTVYRPHSEISRINQIAGRRAVRVEPNLFALLQRAVDLSEATAGAFDITSGPLSKAWGFFRREGRFPAESEVRQAIRQVGYRALELDGERREIRFTSDGLEINLGAIGKGYALDRCAALLESEGITDFMIHGGRSSILARGQRANEVSTGRGWSVALRHPLKPEKQLAVVWLRDRAIGTSGDANQFFYHQGRRFGHIVDPRTGYPAEGILSTTVVAASAADADALATALFVMSKEEAIAFCRSRGDFGLLLVTPGGRSGETELTIVGLDPSDVEDPSARVSSTEST